MYKWYHTVFVFLHLPYFTKHNTLRVHPYCTLLVFLLVLPYQKIALQKYFLFIDRETWGNSLVIQWWGLSLFTAWARVQSLVGKLRYSKPHSMTKEKKIKRLGKKFMKWNHLTEEQVMSFYLFKSTFVFLRSLKSFSHIDFVHLLD